MNLLLATTNKGKATEIREALAGLTIEIVLPTDLTPPIEMPEETGTTFRDNAMKKAQFCYDQSFIPTLADDSGIIVEAMRDELGIHTRRWGPGKDATDEVWIKAFLERMAMEENRCATFVCVLAYVDASGRIHTFEGKSEGVITSSIEAPYLPGLPLSGCFKPNGYERVFSALSIEQKNSTSHRGRALMAFRKFLAQAAGR